MAVAIAKVFSNGKLKVSRKFTAQGYGTAYGAASQWANIKAYQVPQGTWRVEKEE